MPACRKRASTLRQAQGDTCHGELVEPWIPDYYLGNDDKGHIDNKIDFEIGSRKTG